MIYDEIINQIFESKYEKIEENIYRKYYERLKIITEENEEERNNKKMNIISELYYKQGFKDGINIIIKNFSK